ncbi:MAG TPA: DNA polymerase III subunit delta [Micropepsaceae bacterium]|nr:DNA polymerase III subunit delta [Micropepsaceae bacterium]
MEVKTALVGRFIAEPPDKLVAALVFGPDYGVVRERANALALTAVPDLADPFRVVELDESKILSDPACLSDEAAALSMTGGRRLIRIRDAGNNLSPAMARFLDDPAGDALIVIEAGDLAKSSSLRQLFVRANNAAAIACYPDTERDLEPLVRAALKAEKLSIDSDALRVLVSRLGSDRGVTRSELEKLSLYAMGDNVVTEAHIDAVMGDESQLRIEEAADAAGTGDYIRLDRTLTRLWAAGTMPATVLRRAMGHFQQVLAASGDVAGGTDAASAMKKLRPPVHFSRSRSFLAQVSRWNNESILRALNLLYEAEALTRTTGVPEEAACSRALFTVAALAHMDRR